MFRHEAELEKQFRNQFRQEEGRLVFRRGARGAPVVVNQAEVEQAVSLFMKRQRLVLIAMVAVTIAAIFFLVLYDNGRLADAEWTTWALVVLWLVAFWPAFMWAWRTPTAEFARRVPVGRERSRQELRAETLSNWGWPRVIGGLALGLALTVPHLFAWPPAGLDAWLWFGLGIVLVVISCVNCLHKWRLHHRSG